MTEVKQQRWHPQPGTKVRKQAYRLCSPGSYDERAVIIFARGPNEALRLRWVPSSDVWQDCDPTDLRAFREPWADAYADTEQVPIRAYLEHGWWWECYGDHCGAVVTLETLGGMDDQDCPLCVECAAEAQGKAMRK